MKRRTRPRSRLASLFVGIPPLSHADSLTDADAWFAIMQVREIAVEVFDPPEVDAFNQYSAEFLTSRGLTERFDPVGYAELLRDGQAIAGCGVDNLPVGSTWNI